MEEEAQDNNKVLVKDSKIDNETEILDGTVEASKTDSAIMGKPESMDKLKHIVSGVEHFGNGEEQAESIAFLVVDSLLGTMGGVESFKEDEADNPHSVMLNSRAAIVAGELIPWLPCLEEHEGFMSARTRMVRGLLAILRACTRNRAMCSAAGLLGVLLRSAENVFVQDSGVSEKLHCWM